MKWSHQCYPLLSILIVLIASPCSAGDPLPEPLILEAALDAIDESHPQIARSRGEIDSSQAAVEKAAAQDDANLVLSLEARYVDPYDQSAYDGKNDSRATLSLEKRLYDFGRTHHKIQAAKNRLQARHTDFQGTQLALRKQVMHDFFKVIVADLAAATANEAMSIAYVRLDRARDRYKLGEISDVELLELESIYQEMLLKRQQAEVAQRQTRNQLALTLNRPDELSQHLEAPPLPGLLNPLPDEQTALDETLTHNPKMIALNTEREALEQEYDAAKSNRYPEVYGRLEAREYRQEFGSRAPVTGIIGIDVPLYQGGRVSAEIDAITAKKRVLTAKLRNLTYILRQQVLETLQEIETLKLQLKQAALKEEYRELYLDLARARYDLEIESDLGDAMTEQTAAREYAARTRFDLALARETLVTLTANPAWSALAPATDAATSKENDQ